VHFTKNNNVVLLFKNTLEG